MSGWMGGLDGRAEFRLHHPTPHEVALTFEKPWEGNASGYATVFQDGDIYRMYYRGHRYIIDPPPLRQAQSEVVCYAESRDGVHWVKPNLGLFDWPPTMNNTGTKENNIFWRGGYETHNFAPFKDTNPSETNLRAMHEFALRLVAANFAPGDILLRLLTVGKRSRGEERVPIGVCLLKSGRHRDF